MDTTYFILTKPNDAAVEDRSRDQVWTARTQKTYILPSVNVQYYQNRGLFEAWLIEWSKQLCGQDRVFLDIGAHTGTYSISLAPHCRSVMAFEPQRNTFYALCGSVALSNAANVECFQFALGSETQIGARTLQIRSLDGGGSSLCLPDTETVLREEKVEVRTMDSLELQDVGFLKIDAEGNELEILRGGRETLIRCGRPKILFESNAGVDETLFGYIQNDLGYRAIVAIRGSNNMFLAEP